MFKKFILLFIIQLFIINPSISMEKETTFNKKLFDKAQSEGKSCNSKFLDKILLFMR